METVFNENPEVGHVVSFLFEDEILYRTGVIDFITETSYLVEDLDGTLFKLPKNAKFPKRGRPARYKEYEVLKASILAKKANSEGILGEKLHLVASQENPNWWVFSSEELAREFVKEHKSSGEKPKYIGQVVEINPTKLYQN